jgi:hypothetical protein
MGVDATALNGQDEPEQDDLSLVLKRLMSRESSTRKTAESRRRLANSPLTREYLEAGLRLIAEQFEPENHGSRNDDDEGQAPSPFFSWLSAQKVINEVTRGARVRGNQGTFEDRWPYRDYFIEDLLAYSLWAKHWSERAAIARHAVQPLSHRPDFVQAVQEACYHECRAALTSPSARLWLIVNAIVDRYPEMKAAMSDIRLMMDSKWTPVYQVVLASRGLNLRSDVTPEKLRGMISALVTGMSMRINTDPDKAMIDDENLRSALGDAVLAMLAGCIDTGDGKSVADLIRDLTGPSSANGRTQQA